MPRIDIRVDGSGFPEVTRGANVVMVQEDRPICIATLDGAMSSGKPGMEILLDVSLPTAQRRTIACARTSVKLFQMAAMAMLQKYGDLTAGAFSGLVSCGTAVITMSDAVKCVRCLDQHPAPYKFCPNCGLGTTKL